MQHGVVKWFDPVKGYGFLAGDDGKDVFIHHSNILMKGFRLLEAGQRVSGGEMEGEKLFLSWQYGYACAAF